MDDIIVDSDQKAFENYIKNNIITQHDILEKNIDGYYWSDTRGQFHLWQAARNHYAPKLTETEATRMVSEHLSRHGKITLYFYEEQAKTIISDLIAAGIKFKPSRTEGSDNA